MNNTIVFPRGGGGNWLSNLIHNLEQGCPPLVQPGTAYDGRTRTQSIPFRHGYDITEQGIVYYVDPTQPYWLFSTNCAFNLYLNDIVKVRLNPAFATNTLYQTPLERFGTFTDSARYLLTDPLHAQTYYSDIDLDLAMVFQNPDKFVEQLFALLDQAEITYTKNSLYAVESCKQFAATCPDPMDYINQWDRVEWLAWCHAVLMRENILIPADLSRLTTVDNIAQALKPFQQSVLEQTQKTYFTKNETAT